MRRVLAIVIVSCLLCSIFLPVSAQTSSDNYGVQVATWDESFVSHGISHHDIQTETERVITSTNGTTESVYYHDFSTGIATLSIDGEVTETYDIAAEREKIETWTIPENDLILIHQYLKAIQGESKQQNAATLPNSLVGKYNLEYYGDAVLITPIRSESSTRATTTTPYFTAYEDVTNKYPPYSNKLIKFQVQYSPYCQRNLSVKLFETMTNYVETYNRGRNFGAGTELQAISGILGVALSLVMSSLNGYFSVVGEAMFLDQPVFYSAEAEFSFYGTNEVQIYDYTNYQRYVTVKFWDGYGLLTLGWDRNEDRERINPEWMRTEEPYSFDVGAQVLIDEAVDIWEFNIREYGYWLS